MLTIRHAQMAVLAAAGDEGTEERALTHLRNCIPQVCAKLSEAELLEVIRWARRRSRQYGLEREFDFFRYLNLMFMFGFGFDTDPQFPWAARALGSKDLGGSARMDLLMDHAMLF